jgi:hypothetical protein
MLAAPTYKEPVPRAPPHHSTPPLLFSRVSRVQTQGTPPPPSPTCRLRCIHVHAGACTQAADPLAAPGRPARPAQLAHPLPPLPHSFPPRGAPFAIRLHGSSPALPSPPSPFRSSARRDSIASTPLISCRSRLT